MHFEANMGQAPAGVEFVSRGRGAGLALAGGDATLSVAGTDGAGPRTLRIGLVGARAGKPEASEPLGTAVSYLVGNDPSRWRAGVATYARIAYRELRPGVDLVYHAAAGALEYDLVVAPGIDPMALEMAITGSDGLVVDERGDLVVRVGQATLRHARPVVYQPAGRERRHVEGRYLLDGDRVRFVIGHYDRGRPLVIDPVLTMDYLSYVGGSGADSVYDMAVDGAGSAYLFGSTSGMAATGGNEGPLGGPNDAFVAKLDLSAATGAASLVWVTYLGGGDSDAPPVFATQRPPPPGAPKGAIRVDAAGRAHVFGTTLSGDFPVVGPAYDTSHAAPGSTSDTFLARLSPTGDRLEYSTFFGGSADDISAGLDLDVAGNAYLTGTTYSADLPLAPASGAYQSTLSGPPSPNGRSGAFVAKLDLSAFGPGALVYSTHLGPSDYGAAVAVGPGGRAYVLGMTSDVTGSFPIFRSFQSTRRGQFDVFVFVFDAAGTLPYYSTRFGGSGIDHPTGTSEGGRDEAGDIAVDAGGNAYLVGTTQSLNFPRTNALGPTGDNQQVNGFVAKLDPSRSGGASLVYSSELGGTGSDEAHSVAVDPEGRAYVTGSTRSPDFRPVTPDAVQSRPAGGSDTFVTVVEPSGSTVGHSTLLGGPDDEVGRSVAARPVEGATEIVVAGTAAGGLLTTPNAYQATNAGGTDAFVYRLAPPKPLAGDPEPPAEPPDDTSPPTGGTQPPDPSVAPSQPAAQPQAGQQPQGSASPPGGAQPHGSPHGQGATAPQPAIQPQGPTAAHGSPIPQVQAQPSPGAQPPAGAAQPAAAGQQAPPVPNAQPQAPVARSPSRLPGRQLQTETEPGSDPPAEPGQFLAASRDRQPVPSPFLALGAAAAGMMLALGLARPRRGIAGARRAPVRAGGGAPPPGTRARRSAPGRFPSAADDRLVACRHGPRPRW
ncbi:MAG: SBBP repeat-containing protein [Acidimicrobiales bacterium]